VVAILMILQKINWPNVIARWRSDNFTWWNGNFRWRNARHRLRNAVPAEFNHWKDERSN